ncbi:hypothetical protein ACUC97_28720 [Escherichia coli]|uniref:hypothetical protein n=1 Tax=Escherichia coli TaxID=562 RepID=UPI00403C8FCA
MAGGLNLYAYAPNPVSWIDPLGLKCGELRNRRQALNKAKDLAGIPRSQQPLEMILEEGDKQIINIRKI